jgi:hypothetical protein
MSAEEFGIVIMTLMLDCDYDIDVSKFGVLVCMHCDEAVIN